MTNDPTRYDPRFSQRLRRRSALAGILVFLIPFGLFYFLADYASERYVRRQVFARLEAGVATNARLLDDTLALRPSELGAQAREPAGAAAPRRSQENLNARLLDLGIGATEDSFLIDSGGRYAASSRRGAGYPGAPAFDPQQANPFAGDSGTAEFHDAQGHLLLAAYRRLTSEPDRLVVQVQWNEIVPQVRALRREILLYVAPFLLLGVVLAGLAWRYAMNYITRLLGELYDALSTARQRERERDSALQELAQRFDEERELAREKSQFQQRLAEYEKYAALAQLALGAAHEINNPLLGILSHLELELRHADAPERREEIVQCIEGAKRISTTVSGLLSYAKPSSLQLTRVNLDRLVTDEFAFLCHQPLFRGIELRKEIAGDLPLLTVDTNQLSQILMNLLLNAAQAMPDGGTITVAAAQAQYAESVELRVTDTGVGIPADVLPRIFDPFFSTKRGKGTGLGLSITQAYVRNHGGEIQVESIPGRGTTVRISLPLRQEGRPAPEIEEVIT